MTWPALAPLSQIGRLPWTSASQPFEISCQLEFVGELTHSPPNSSWHDISKGWLALVQGSLPIWDSGAITGQVIQQRALFSETKITYDDDVRQVELEIQQAYSNLQQDQELVKSPEKNVELADEALR